MRRRDFLLLAGGTIVLPRYALSQYASIPKIGHLWHAGNAEEEGPYFKALIEGFGRLGYVDGHNVLLIHRFPNENPDHFKTMAAELVSMNVDVLMGGNAASSYLKNATSTIPIIFYFVADPIGLKLVDSLARPGGNATGFASFGPDLAGKRLQFLKEIIPKLSQVALLSNPNESVARMYADVYQDMGARLGLAVKPFEARSIQELEPAFDAMVRAGVQAVTVTSGGLAFQGRSIIPRLALMRRLPLGTFSRETFEHGALISYGPNQLAMCRRSTVYVDRILKGAKPSDLPVEQPATLELLINVGTAKTLGLDVPRELLARADEVVEPQ
jgi:putative ABC transport system substrate-binding protein